jgi:isopentenyl-diphosphate Delta-isomerase
MRWQDWHDPKGPHMGELVVLLDEQGNAVGTAAKRDVHGERTPLHLAFSCYVFDGRGSLLVTRRAWHKATWPGVWTNSVCGHPGPGEGIAEAVVRRARQELGVDLKALRLALPRFRYEAVMRNGVRENEMCPVFTALTSGSVRSDPEEVAAAVWQPWVTFRADVINGTTEVSPWCRRQVALLPVDVATRSLAPAQMSAAWRALPPAARRPRRQ